MKKLNLISAAIATIFAASAAQAGTAQATATPFAIESFGPTSGPTATALAPTMSYSMSAATSVNASTTLYFTIRLTGAKWAIADGSADGARFTLAGTVGRANASSDGTNPGVAVTKSADGSTLLVAVQSRTGVSTALGLGAFTFTPVQADINALNQTLGTVGGIVTASIAVTTTLPTAYQSTDTQSSIDGALGTATLMQAVRGVTPAAGATNSAVKIDLTASPAASAYTTGANARIPLGSYKYTVVSTAMLPTGPGNPYVITGATRTNTVVTPGTGQSFPVGSVINVYGDVACTTAVAGATPVTVTSATASSAQTVSVVNTPPAVSGTDLFVCMSAPTTGNVATPITPTLSTTLLSATATDSIGAAAGTGYAVAYNGSTVDIQTYWPGALAPFNFNGYVRLTNTGTVSAAISGQNFTTAGVLNTAQPAAVIATLAAGESKVFSTRAIDAIIGANPSGIEAGRVRITAPTNGLRVTSMLQSSNGQLIEYPNVVNCTTSGGGGTIAANSGGAAVFGLAQLTAISRVTDLGTNTVATNGGVATFANTGLSSLSAIGGGGGTVATVSTACTGNSQ